MPSHIAATPIAAAASIASTGRLVSRSAVGGGPDQQRSAQDRADRHRGQRDRERERHQVAGADQPHGDPARGGQLGADRAEQQRPVQHATIGASASDAEQPRSAGGSSW